MADTILFLCGVIAGIISGITIYKKLPKRILILITHIVVAVIGVLLMSLISSRTKSDFLLSFTFFCACVLVVSLFVNLPLFFVYNIVNKIKNKKTLQAASVGIIFLLVFSVYAVIKIFSISAHALHKEDNNVKNWFRCKMFFGDWIKHSGGWGNLYECGFERTSDGGKSCGTASDCELNCVDSNPASDILPGFSLDCDDDGNYYLHYGNDGVCQTHKRFLDNKTYRKSFEGRVKLGPDDLEEFKNALPDCEMMKRWKEEGLLKNKNK